MKNFDILDDVKVGRFKDNTKNVNVVQMATQMARTRTTEMEAMMQAAATITKIIIMPTTIMAAIEEITIHNVKG